MLTLIKVHFQNIINILISFRYCNGRSPYCNIRPSQIYSIILVILIIQLCNTVNASYKLKGQRNCNRTRSVLTDIQGRITDGSDLYLKENHCEWLIKGKYIFLYDG